MTKKLISVKADDDVSKVAKILYEKHIKRVPVLDGTLRRYVNLDNAASTPAAFSSWFTPRSAG